MVITWLMMVNSGIFLGTSRVMRVPQKRWMGYFMGNPTKIRMIWKYPHFRKLPYIL